MSVKTNVIEMLEKNRGEYFSGEELAKQLDVSRGAVWKAIRSLETEGYAIDAMTKRGYRLLPESDVLSEEGIRSYWNTTQSPSTLGKVYVYKSIDSTNTQAKRLLTEGAVEGTIVLAEEQTQGKGRLGRSFYSPNGQGIYMSIVLKPKLKLEQAVLITTAASVAVCRAIRRVLPIEPQIKWVNDIYCGGKKVCGILTEAVTNFEMGQIESIVVGIGINVKLNRESMPEEIKNRAGGLLSEKDHAISRNELVAAVAQEMMKLYENLATKEYLEDYRAWSCVIGHKVTFLENEEWQQGEAVDIDSEGGLVVRMPEGEFRTLRTGEITLRTLE